MLWILSGHTFEVMFTSVQPIIFLEYATAIKNFIKLSTSGMSPTSDVFSIFPRDSPCARRVMKQPRSQKEAIGHLLSAPGSTDFILPLAEEVRKE